MVCVTPLTTPPTAGSNTMPVMPCPAAAGMAPTLLQVAPPLVVTNKPFEGVPTKTMLGLLGSMAIFWPFPR
jgi:hypothetical protein